MKTLSSVFCHGCSIKDDYRTLVGLEGVNVVNSSDDDEQVCCLNPRQHQPSTKDILPLLDDIVDKRQEHFMVLTYDVSMHLIGKHLVFLGTVSSLICHPREIFAVAIADAASSIVVSHNHPSGDPIPSREDKTTTQQLVAAGIIIGIPLRDHVIVAKSGHFSFSEKQML